MSDSRAVYVVDPNGTMRRMSPAAPSAEEELQLLIAEHPDLIGDEEGDLLLIEREHGVPDAEDACGRWSLDHLFVTRKAVPVLVEVKRAVDTRLRREVVGQMLDYAANSVAHWPSGTLAERFERTCEQSNRNADEMLLEFLRGERDPADFWAQVDANFKAGRVKLLFVADRIPPELARVVEFLDAQMSAEVRAVELRYFQGEQGTRTLVPRSIGGAKSSTSGPLERVTEEQWFAENIAARGPKTVEGARWLREFMKRENAQSGVPSSQGSIYFTVKGADGRDAYPLFLLKNGTATLSFDYTARLPALQDVTARQALYARFAQAVGPLSRPFHENGSPSFPLERLTDASRRAEFEAVCRDYLEACRADVEVPA